MTAKEAREISEIARFNLFKRVLIRIKDESEIGALKITVYTELKDKEREPTEIINKLINLGYNVVSSYSEANGEWRLDINWDLISEEQTA